MELLSYIAFILLIMYLLHPADLKEHKSLNDNDINPSPAKPTPAKPHVTPIEEPVVTTLPFKVTAEWIKPTKKKDYINYVDYIQSPEWQQSERRLNCIKAASNKCQMCGVGFSLEVHHISYSNLGRELPQELVLLCSLCHEHTHAMAGKGARYYPPIKRPTKELPCYQLS